jgi:hypothetical protein
MSGALAPVPYMPSWRAHGQLYLYVYRFISLGDIRHRSQYWSIVRLVLSVIFPSPAPCLSFYLS